MTCTTEVYWEGKAKMSRVANITIRALNNSGRRFLGSLLDPKRLTFSRHAGIVQDWEGLAELMGLSMEEIQALSDKEAKTCSIIEQWSHTSNATIGQLINFLEQMERFDILENDILQHRILDDVELHLKREEKLREEYNREQLPAQLVPENQSLEDCVTFQNVPSPLFDETEALTCQDVESGRKTYYDAFVCFTPEDVSFVGEMTRMLERHGVRLCRPDRDLLIGASEHTAIAHLIKERCTKMIIVLSPHYARSAECDFMTKFGHSIAPGAMAKKLIPVMIQKPCPVPDILRYITLVDYTKCDLSEWFWDKLARSMLDKDCESFMSHSSLAWSTQDMYYSNYTESRGQMERRNRNNSNSPRGQGHHSQVQGHQTQVQGQHRRGQGQPSGPDMGAVYRRPEHLMKKLEQKESEAGVPDCSTGVNMFGAKTRNTNFQENIKMVYSSDDGVQEFNSTMGAPRNYSSISQANPMHMSQTVASNGDPNSNNTQRMIDVYGAASRDSNNLVSSSSDEDQSIVSSSTNSPPTSHRTSPNSQPSYHNSANHHSGESTILFGQPKRSPFDFSKPFNKISRSGRESLKATKPKKPKMKNSSKC